jgi:chromosome segregation ATPase
LESKRRKYTIEIGEISRDIQQVDEDLKTAKRKDIPDLESQREELVARKLKLESQLDRVKHPVIAAESAYIAPRCDVRAHLQTVGFHPAASNQRGVPPHTRVIPS